MRLEPLFCLMIKEDNMERTIELKLSGDGYAGGFSCGATMCMSGTLNRFSLEKSEDGLKVYSSPEGLKVYVKSRKVNGAERITTSFYNGSDKPVTLEMLASLAIKNVVADKVHRLQSFWSAEGKLRTETVKELHLEPSWNRCGLRFEKFGNTGSMPVRKYFPFVALEDSKSGSFTALLLCCGGSWQIELLCKDDDTLTVCGGLADGDFGQWRKNVLPGGTFTAPEAILAEGSSLEDVCDKLVKAQEPDISPVDDGMGIMFNEYCTTWGNPSFENVKKICDKIAGRGIKYLVIDSGWYGHERWWESVGDWEVNEERFPGGMKPIADYIRSKGMIPGLWFEPEAVARGCAYYNEPTHLLKKYGEPLTVGDRRFFDMEDPWVKKYLNEKVIKLLKDCGFGYIKIDYNDSLGMGTDGAESIGEGLRRKTEASREFFRTLSKEIPGLVIENCSSGGHRLTPAFMELASQASFSDAHETAAIPIIAANLHRVIRPDQSQIWAVLRAGDSPERLNYTLCSAFLGRMCLSGDIYNLSDEQWETVDKAIAFYREAADIIKYGKTVRRECTADSYNKPEGYQVLVREYAGKALTVLHRFENSDLPQDVFPDLEKTTAHFGSAVCDFSAEAWISRI